MRSGARWAAVLAAVGGAVLAACASGSQYVANRDEQVFLKVPDGWTILREDPPTTTSSGASVAGLPWFVVLDRDRAPSKEHLNAESPAAPVGIVYVDALTPEQRDTFSLAGLRSLALGLDPFEEGTGDTGVEVLGYDPDFTVNGYHGNRIRLALANADGSTVILDQVALLDAARTRLYVVQFRCERRCFESNLAEITDIIESLQIRREQQ